MFVIKFTIMIAFSTVNYNETFKCVIIIPFLPSSRERVSFWRDVYRFSIVLLLIAISRTHCAAFERRCNARWSRESSVDRFQFASCERDPHSEPVFSFCLLTEEAAISLHFFLFFFEFYVDTFRVFRNVGKSCALARKYSDSKSSVNRVYSVWKSTF